MNCPQARELQQLIDDALPSDQAAPMQAHLETCSACQKTLERLVAGAATWDKAAINLADKQTHEETALADAVEKLQGAPTSVDVSRSGASTTSEIDLSFLAPSQKPGSLGRLDEFEILSVVGKGGFGIVLKAFDENLHRIVAIKVMLPHMAANGTARQRFVKEARAAAPITHENVVTIHGVKGDAKTPYLAMQFVSGQTLNEKIDKSGPLSVKEILRIGMQMAEGLAAAHKQGLVHRDIKPANILLENGVERVKITDFGLARSVDDASLTQSGTVAGTPMYMSPEQANGDSIDHRSDLFSLGSVLYVMCTGRAPFRANSTLAVMKRVADETPTPIREVNADIPDWLCDIVTKLHAKKPSERYQTAKEVAEVLGKLLANLQQPYKTSAPATITAKVETPRTARILNPFSVAGAGVACVVLLGVMWYGGIDVPSICIAAMLCFGGLALIAYGVAPLYRRGRWLVPQALLYGAIAVGAAVLWIRHTTPATLSFTFRHPDAVVIVEGQGGKREFRSDKPDHTQTNADFAPGTYRMTVTVHGDVTQTEEFTLGSGDFKEWILEPLGQVQVVNRSKESVLVSGPGVSQYEVGSNSAGTFPSLVGPHRWHRAGERGKVAGEFIVKQGKTFLLNVPADAAPEKEWVQLFNKKDLTGWSTEKPQDWKVENGVLTGSAGKLRSDKQFENFELRAEIKLRFPGTADLCFRSTKLDWAYAPLGNKWLSECTGSLAYMPKNEKTQLLVDYSSSRASEDDWLQLVVRVEGKTASVRLNGVLTAQADIADMAPRGFIEWHVDGDKKLMVRKLEIRELPTPQATKRDDAWVRLFNGKDLSGWKSFPEDSTGWTVKNGILEGRGPDNYLFSTRSDFTNFHLRAEVKINAQGDSGVYFRMRPQTGEVVPEDGYEVQLNGDVKDELPTGSLFGVGALAAAPKGLVLPEIWFNLEIIADGGKLTVKVNDKECVSHAEASPLVRGHLALQAYTKDTVVSFRKIEIMEIPNIKPMPAGDYALHFDGSTYAEIPLLRLPVMEPYTMEGFLRPGKGVNNSCAFGIRDQSFLKFTGKGDWRWDWTDNSKGKGKIAIFGAPRDQARDHVACVSDGKQCRLFINGKLHQVKAIGEAVEGQSLFRIGDLFDGVIDEVRISKSARYTTNFDVPKRCDTDRNTLALYHFNEGHGNLVVDSSGNGYHGSIVGAKWVYSDGSVIPADLADWTQLFNGKDVAGWKNDDVGNWKVENGHLIGKGPSAKIRTERTDFSDFHLRAECKYTAAEGHLWIRHQGSTQLPGYQIYMRNLKGNFHTGALAVTFENKAQTIQVREERTKQGEWFKLEVIARGNQIQTYVNGEKALDFTDAKNHYVRGAIQLGVPGNEGELYFKKIEIKEFAAGKDPVAAPSGRKAELNAIGIAYHEFTDKHRKAPNNADDLQPFLTKHPDAWKTLGDGSLIFLYDVNVLDFLPDASKFVLAYDKKTPENGGMVLMVDGIVKEVSAAEFKRLPMMPIAPKSAIAPLNADQAKSLQDAWAKRLGVEVEIKNSLGMKFRLIPPGEYDRGATDVETDATEHEKPRHRVVIQKAFYIGATEVTLTQFKEVMGLGTSGRDYPVVGVSWSDAVQFCKNLNAREAEKKAGRVYRLVADAEWEYACRAGTVEPYYFGSVENINSYAWIQGNSRGIAGDETKKVGTRKPNAWGLYDMIGNVHEWCADEYVPYEKDKVVHDPQKPLEMVEGDNHVVRYSSIVTPAKNARSAARLPMAARARRDNVGFRVVMIGGFKD